MIPGYSYNCYRCGELIRMFDTAHCCRSQFENQFSTAQVPKLVAKELYDAKVEDLKNAQRRIDELRLKLREKEAELASIAIELKVLNDSVDALLNK